MSEYVDNGPRLIEPAEFPRWIVEEDDDVIVLNKPGDIVCHPSKNGPWSSLVGACREQLQLPRVHNDLPARSRDERVMVFAKNSAMAGRLQTAVEGRRVRKLYLAILSGELREPVMVDAPLGRDLSSSIVARQAVVRGPEGRPAVTEFIPVAHGGGVHWCGAASDRQAAPNPRANAASIGCPILGDKLYGPDQLLFLEFIRDGFTPRLASLLTLPRHALHALEMRFDPGEGGRTFRAPLTPDLHTLCPRADGTRRGDARGGRGGGVGAIGRFAEDARVTAARRFGAEHRRLREDGPRRGASA
jgi:23S rRNA pseudouridine1911/1915/1917 synthase